MKTPLIEISRLRFRFPEQHYLFRGLDFTLGYGEKIALCGENGAGKSTLFLNILGLLPFEDGVVRFLGKECRKPNDFVFVRANTGLLFQDPDDQLFCPSVIEDVAFGLMNQGLSQKQAQKKSEEVLERLGISHLAERVPYKLSGGEKRMASLATILAMEPDILLLDEPTTGLSERYRAVLVDALKAYDAKGMVIISHDNHFLDQMADRKVLLKNGEITDFK